MTEKRIVIKINQRKIPTTSAIEPEMITEWNIPRLVMGFLGLVLFIGLLFFWIAYQYEDVSRDGVVQNIQGDNGVRNKHAEIDNVMTSAVAQKEMITHPVKTEEMMAGAAPDIHIKKETVNVAEEKYKAPVEINIADKRVSRAVIAYALKQKEPEEIVAGWVKADKAKAVGVYFFTEIKQMKGEVLFHKWYLNNKTIFSRRLNILGDNWRASTRKLITYSQKGEWRVALVNRKQKVLAEIRFYVI